MILPLGLRLYTGAGDATIDGEALILGSVAPTFVTGASGFVGSAVARALAASGYALRLLVRRHTDRRNLAGLEAEFVEGDLTDLPSLARGLAGCCYAVHVAADYRLWVPDPTAMRATNVGGTLALMKAALEAGVERVVYTSSVAALGLNADGTAANEETPLDPATIVGAYKRSKFEAEQEVLRLVRNEGLKAVIVNPAAPMGPRDRRPTPTGRIVCDAARGRIPAYVDTGINVVHVDDVGIGHVLALERGRVGERYILGGENLALREILALIAELCSRAPPRVRLPAAPLWPLAVAAEAWARLTGSEPMMTRDTLRMAKKRMFFSSAKAVDELGYAARPAREAIADALAWFRKNGMLG